MPAIDKNKAERFKELIEYKFNNEDLLVQALTTPRLANKLNIPSYEFLENLGDAVLKIIFILKLYKRGIIDPGEITKVKAVLESDDTLKKVANKIELERFIFKAEKQRVKGTRILADVFEAICGALFLDSDYNLRLIEEKIIDPFYDNFELIIQNSINSSKNILLEYLQEKFKTTVAIKLEYKKGGLEHEPIWVARNPVILNKTNHKELIEIPKGIESSQFKSKKEAEKEIYQKILKILVERDHKEI
ncbi:MAG: ribonuclease III domain-containing protein [Candidatus Thorarchaeota archaeon]